VQGRGDPKSRDPPRRLRRRCRPDHHVAVMISSSLVVHPNFEDRDRS
jgi:hypothetical protein